jgi:site-specific DNA-methyltransferase (adenine-specific)
VLDVLEFPYSGNRLHPTQKLVEPPENAHPNLHPAGQVVLDLFCGSGHTLAAGRSWSAGLSASISTPRTARLPQASVDRRGLPSRSGLIPLQAFQPNPHLPYPSIRSLCR